MLASATVADLLRPAERGWAAFYDVALIIGGSLLIALCARLAVWLPFSPVPVTGQTFAVLMIGALFGARRAGLSVLAYIIEGAVGLPVFAAGAGGVAWLLGLNGGYLIGFVPAAYITGFLAQNRWDRRVWTIVLAMILGNVVIYAFGLLWLFCLKHLFMLPIARDGILASGLYPFIIGDLLKIALAAAVLPSGWKLLGYSGFVSKRE